MAKAKSKTTTIKNTTKKTNAVGKKTITKPVITKRKTKLEKAEELRRENVKACSKLTCILGQWDKKLKKCSTHEERVRVDVEMTKKYSEAEKREHASYSAYYDYVNKNFTREQQIKAMQVSKDFMSKKYINALAGGQNGKK